MAVGAAPSDSGHELAGKSLSGEEIFHLLARRMTDGSYPPGTRLRDHRVAAELGVSRTPVREALQRLERVGLIEVHPNRYTAVTDVNDEAIRSTRQFAAMQTATMARLAIPRLGEGDRAWASQLADDAARTILDGGEWLPAHAQLLEHLFRRTENRLFSFLLEDLWFVVLRNLTQAHLPADERAGIAAAVSDLGAAIRASDVAAAEEAARRMFGNLD